MNKFIPVAGLILLCGCASTRMKNEAISPDSGVKKNSTGQSNEDTSFNVAKYSSIDDQIKTDRETARLAASRPKAKETSEPTDSVTNRYAINLDENSQTSKTIDSLDKKIDSLKTNLFADTRTRKMKKYTTSDKVEYMKYLIKNKFKTIDEVTVIATKVQDILTLERQKISTIMSVQTGNAKVALHGNLSSKDRDIQTVADFLSSISQDPGLQIEHAKTNLDP